VNWIVSGLVEFERLVKNAPKSKDFREWTEGLLKGVSKAVSLDGLTMNQKRQLSNSIFEILAVHKPDGESLWLKQKENVNEWVEIL